MQQKKPDTSDSSAHGPATFDPGARVRKRFEYRLVQNKGRRVSTPHFTILVSTRAPSQTAPGGAPIDPPRSRLGVTVTKKVGNAVARNRVKRVLREVFRRNQSVFSAMNDYVFIAKDGAPELGYQEVLAEVRAVAHALAAERGSGPQSARRSHR
ncbi:MAG: ribonuclease P protein component [Sandaracinaceae bacterium]|nr:ribonuclease P protein component [Sandaracinaceae bacterium]